MAYAIDYMNIISLYYEESQCHCNGEPTDYNAIVWDSNPVSQADLDVIWLIHYKTEKIMEFSLLAQEEIIDGFESDALGTPHFYDSDPADQLNLIGAVASQSDMPYSCRPLTRGYDEIIFSASINGTDSTGYSNDVTTYNAEVVVDGVSTYVSVIGQNAQTFDDLLVAVQADLSAGTHPSTIVIESDKIRIYSDIYGNTSTVNIIDADLFSSLPNYVSNGPEVAGLSGSDVVNKVYKQHTSAQLLQVLNDGKDIKLTSLQKFNVKRALIMEAADAAAIDLITWE